MHLARTGAMPATAKDPLFVWTYIRRVAHVNVAPKGIGIHSTRRYLPMAQLLAPFQPAHGRFTEAGFVGIYGRRGGRMPGAEADFAVA